MSGLDPQAIEDWRRAIGRERIEMQMLHKQNLRRYALALGLAGEDARPPLPLWAFFLPAPADDEIGDDGHPRRGGFLPAISLPRRMFASGTMTFEAPIDAGGEATLMRADALLTF